MNKYLICYLIVEYITGIFFISILTVQNLTAVGWYGFKEVIISDFDINAHVSSYLMYLIEYIIFIVCLLVQMKTI